jgi:hypothetical protein
MACIVHQNIDAAEFCPCRCNNLRAICFARQISGGEASASSNLRNLSCCEGQFLFRARRKKHGSAFFRKKLRDGPAYSAPGAGNEGNTIFEFHREIEDSGNCEKWQAAKFEIELWAWHCLLANNCPSGQVHSYFAVSNLYRITGYSWRCHHQRLPMPFLQLRPPRVQPLKI